MIDKKSIHTDLPIDKVREIIKDNIGINFAPNQPFATIMDSSDRLFVGSIDGDSFKAVPNNNITRGANSLIFHGKLVEDDSDKTIIDLKLSIFQNYISLIGPLIFVTLTSLIISFTLTDNLIVRILSWVIGIILGLLIYSYWRNRQSDYEDMAAEYFIKMQELFR